MSIPLPPAAAGSRPEPWRGGELSARVRCLLAPNPGPMTLDGTNTYLLAEPGTSQAVVVDPGPEHEGHRAATWAALAERDQRAALVLLTHGHPDHAEGAAAFARRAGCPVRAVDPGLRTGAEGLADGDTVTVAGLVVRVVATPGHTADSVSLLLPADNALLTGDTVLGRGTTVVAHPDGRLADYLDSLARLEALAENNPGLRLLPGHGPAGASVGAVVAAYRAHRAVRLDQVVAAVGSGADDLDAVVAHVYADVDRSLWPAARRTVQAQVDYLCSTGRLVVDVSGACGGLRVSARGA